MKIVGFLVAAGGIFAIIFLCSVGILKIAWPWVIPDLFPGAVQQGLIASQLSWYTAVKLALFLSLVLSRFFRSASSD